MASSSSRGHEDFPMLVYNAVARGDANSVNIRLAAGDDPNTTAPEWYSMLNYSPLHVAVLDNNVDIVRTLLEAKANPNICHSQKRMTPLHSAALNGRPECAALLVRHGAELDARAWNLTTPLHLACSGGKDEVMLLLVDLRADITAEDQNGCMPLDYALQGAKYRTAQILLSREFPRCVLDVFDRSMWEYHSRFPDSSQGFLSVLKKYQAVSEAHYFLLISELGLGVGNHVVANIVMSYVNGASPADQAGKTYHRYCSLRLHGVEALQRNDEQELQTVLTSIQADHLGYSPDNAQIYDVDRELALWYPPGHLQMFANGPLAPPQDKNLPHTFLVSYREQVTNALAVGRLPQPVHSSSTTAPLVVMNDSPSARPGALHDTTADSSENVDTNVPQAPANTDKRPAAKRSLAFTAASRDNQELAKRRKALTLHQLA